MDARKQAGEKKESRSIAGAAETAPLLRFCWRSISYRAEAHCLTFFEFQRALGNWNDAADWFNAARTVALAREGRL